MNADASAFTAEAANAAAFMASHEATPAVDVAASAIALPMPSNVAKADVSPYVLLRFATVPADMLDALSPARTNELVARWHDAERCAQACSAVLGDGLFTLVSRIEGGDKAYRRAVLKLKRDMHNDVTRDVDSALLARIRGDLAAFEPTMVSTLDTWCDAQDRRQQLEAAAEAMLVEELAARIRPGLRRALDLPMFARAMAIASPGVLRHALTECTLPTRGEPDNFERSLFAYLVRATVKTSPFSSFMSTAVASFDTEEKLPVRLDGALQTCYSRLNRGLLSRIAVLAREAAADGPLRLHVEPSLTRVEGQRLRMYCERDLVTMGRPWRQHTVTHFRMQENLIAALSDEQAEAEAEGRIWGDRFSMLGLDAARSRDLVRQLHDRGVLRARQYADAFEIDVAGALSAHLACLGGGLPAALREGLDAIRAALHSLAGDAAQAAASMYVIRDQAKALLAHKPQRSGMDIHNAVLDDCWTSTAVPAAVPLPGAVADLAAFLSTQVVTSPMYARLRDQFVARFGEGGRSSSVFTFLSEAGPGLLAPVEYGARQEWPVPVEAPPRAPLTVTVQAQYLPDAGPNGPELVVNKVYEHAGWLAARFAVGATPGHQRLREGIRMWMEQLAPGREAVDLTVNGDCNDLQAHPRILARALAWPGEPVLGDASGRLDINSTELSHDPATGLLVLTTREGQPVEPVYLGGTLPSPAWGVAYAMILLGRPYELSRPVLQPPTEQVDDIRFMPRMLAGRAMVRRATWWVRTAYLRRAWFATAGARRLLDVRRECTVAGLPGLFFARLPQDAAHKAQGEGVLEARRKPLWVDIAQPFCLSALERLIRAGEWVSFTEALPVPTAAALQVDARPHVAEVQFELALRKATLV